MQKIRIYKGQDLTTTDTRATESQQNTGMVATIQKFRTVNRYLGKQASREINIVLFGKHEDGKTTVADLLLGEYEKVEQVDFQGLTVPTPSREPRQTDTDDGIKIRVLDVDARMSASRAKRLVRKKFPNGIHCALYVWNVGKHRFVPSDRAFLADYTVRNNRIIFLQYNTVDCEYSLQT